MGYIEQDAISTSEAIREKVSHEERKIHKTISEDVYFIKNELACQMEERDNRLEEDMKRESIAKLISSENSKENVKHVLDQEFSEEDGFSRDDGVQQLIHESGINMDETNIDVTGLETDEDDWWFDE